MTLIADVGNYFLNSDRSWGRRERRLMDTILVRYRNLAQEYKEVHGLVDPKSLDTSDTYLRSLRKVKSNLARDALRIAKDLKELIHMEFQEFERDINEPYTAFKEIITVIEAYLLYLKKEGIFSPDGDGKLQGLFEKFKNTYVGVNAALTESLQKVQSAYERELKHPGSAFTNKANINELASVGEQWEAQKVALSQRIRTLIRDFDRFHEELVRHLASHHHQAVPTKELKELLDEQKKLVSKVYSLVKDEKVPLSEGIQKRAETGLKEAVFLEYRIQKKLEELRAVEKLTNIQPHLSAEDRVRAAPIKFRTIKGKSGQFPVEFWLGPTRALDYLKKNDTKNVSWLKELLKEGLLEGGAEGNLGTLYERIQAFNFCVSKGMLNVQDQEITAYLEQYSGNFDNLIQHIHQRAELSIRVFGLIGASLLDLEGMIINSRTIIERALDQASALERSRRVKEGVTHASQIREKKLALVKREEERDAHKDLSVIDASRKQAVGEVVVLQQEIRKRRKQGMGFFSGISFKVAAVLVPILAAGAISFAANRAGPLPTSGEARIAAIVQVEKQVQESKFDSLKKKISAAQSPVEILYEASPEEMQALYESGRATILWTLKDFGIGQLGDATKEVYKIQKKINSGTKLEEREVRFLKNYYYLLAIGGKANGMDQSSQLLMHYLDGSGSDVELDASIYKGSKAVEAAQEEMLRYVRANFKEGDTGRLTSAQVFKSTGSFKGGYEKSGGIVKGEPGDSKLYIIAEQGNSALKNTNNRFILTADFAIKGGKIILTWRVDDDYSFEADRGYETELKVPGTSQKLVLSDALSAKLTHYGAKPFNHHARWNAVENVKG